MATPLVRSTLLFIKELTKEYGPEEGMKVWDSMSSLLSPEFKGEVFLALLGSETPAETLVLTGADLIPNRVAQVKALRVATNCGLKVAMDAINAAQIGIKTSFRLYEPLTSNGMYELDSVGLRWSTE